MASIKRATHTSTSSKVSAVLVVSKNLGGHRDVAASLDLAVVIHQRSSQKEKVKKVSASLYPLLKRDKGAV